MPQWSRNSHTRRGLLAGMAGALSGCSALLPERTGEPAAGDWPMQGARPVGDYHQTGVDAPTEGVRVRWERSVEPAFGSVSYPEPVLYDGSLYLASDTLDVYDAADGAKRGSIDVPLVGPPAVTRPTAYRNATLVGVTSGSSPLSGIVRSGDSDTERVPSPGVAGLNADPTLPGNPALGLRWRFPHEGGRFSFWNDESGFGVVPVGDRLLLGGGWRRPDGSRNSGLLALRPSSGDIVWRYTPASRDGLSSITPNRPSVRDGTAYVTTVTGVCHAVSVTDGTRQWRRALPVEVMQTYPIVATERTVVVSGPDSLQGLDRDSGRTRWRREPEGRGVHSEHSLTAADGTVLLRRDIDDGEVLLAFDAETGQRVWRAEIDPTEGQPVVADGTVYYGSGDVLAARDLTDGTRRWAFDPDAGARLSAPVVGDGVVYLWAQKRLYALEAPA